MSLYYISFCIKAGSTERKAKPTVLWTDVINLSISDYLAVEGNDSSSPQITRFCVLFLLLVHPDTLGVSLHSSGTRSNTCLISLSPSLPPSPPSFSQWSQLLQAKIKTYESGKEGEEKSWELKKAHLNTEKWVINLHTVQRTAVF